MNIQAFNYSFTGFELAVYAEGDHVVRIHFGKAASGTALRENEVIRAAHAQITQYAAGKLTAFTVPLKYNGTDFQMKVWRALAQIPYGATTTYQAVAAQCGNPKAYRAAANAIHNNPIAIIIPCHRVIGSNGKLTGFAGGLDVKKLLLDIEAAPNIA
ncbi:hypothetical protein FACS1894103_0850 [Campylobacterota bacterium]|nr:hypothetical protein FACS1894103_0850 [Campylobacterota bacterium]